MKGVTAFLRESNAIENVYSTEALKAARLAWNFISRLKTVTPETINFAHLMLMQPIDLESKFKGAFRRQPVWIGGHEAKPWYVVPKLIEQWCRVANRKQKSQEDIIADHVSFESIHGWIDGNGRIGRILYNWERIRNGFDIDIIYEKNKRSYYCWFEK